MRNLLGVLLILFCAALGAEPLVLSLDDAVGRILDQSIDLQSRSLDTSSAKYAADRLWAEIFPGISATAGLSYGTPLFSGDGFRANADNLGYSTSVGLSFSFNAGLPYAMKILELAYRTQLLSYENARRQLEIQAAKDFFALITERERLVHLEQMSELAERQREKSRIAFQNGLSGELAYLQSRLTAETARLNLNQARTNYTTQLGTFLSLLGLNQTDEVVLDGLISINHIVIDADQLIPEYLAKRPDILSQRQTIERLEYTKSQTLLNARAPSLSLSGQWRGGSSGAGGLSAPFSDTLTGSLTLSIPLDSWIPGTKKEQGIRSANTELEKATLTLRNTETNAANQIRSLAASLRNSWSTVEISRLRVQIAERTYELTEQGFQQGAVEYLTLEDTRNSMSEARQQLLTNELAYQNMILDLAAALNIAWKDLMRSGALLRNVSD
ncbi:transporter [Spirochaetia bacterium]|nr:transporter [Spirochaetia bacterium]